VHIRSISDISVPYISHKESFINKGLESVFNPQVGFYYFPVASSDNTLYLRFNYFADRDKQAKNFYQLQFGYKASLKLSK
jgi:hypothetical protein